MSTIAQHGAAIASPSVARAASSSNADGWVTVAQAALSFAIVLALAILWWRTLHPERSVKREAERR
jgi:hypothetical protein